MSSGKVIVITGTTRGIGKALAEELSARGHRVFGTGRTRISEKDIAFTPVIVDITDINSIRRGIKKILSAVDRIDVLINNAGISHCGAVEETPLETMKSIFETNYFGMVRVIQEVLPVMRSHGKGTIINIGSLAGKIGIPFQPHYAASKFAVEGLTESLLHEMRPLGIRVILIEPGDVGTTIWENRKETPMTNSPYRHLLERFHAVKMKEMGASVDPPEKVAKEIADIVDSGKKGFRFTVAKGSSLISLARKLLPDAIFLRIIARNYDLIS